MHGETFEKFYSNAEFYPSTAEAIEFQNDLFTAVNDHLVAPGIGNERFRPVCNDRLCLGSFEANNGIQLLSLALDRMSRSLKTSTALVQSYQDVGNGRIAVNFLINFDKPVAISRKSEG